MKFIVIAIGMESNGINSFLVKTLDLKTKQEHYIKVSDEFVKKLRIGSEIEIIYNLKD